MEDSKNKQQGNPPKESSSFSPPSSLDSSAGIPTAYDGSNGVHQDASTNKHNYSKGHGIRGRSPESPNSPNRTKEMDPSRSLIDTAAPFESVKAAVNMFGGTVDWKAQRVLTKERSRNFEQEIGKAEQELPLYQKQLEAAEDAKARVLQELETTKKHVEELRLKLEKVRTEETQAQQDSELAKLRVAEIEQGIGNEASMAAKAQLKVARTRYSEADDELESVKAELEALKIEYALLIKERDTTLKKAEQAALAYKEAEKTVEEFTAELIAVKETLESAQASHLKAEEQRLNAAMAMEHETRNWKQQLKHSQEELLSLEEQLPKESDLKLKLETASALLSTLKAELSAYMETKLNQESEPKSSEQGDGAALTAAKKELEELKASIEKASDEVIYLRVAASSLKSELETEASSLTSLKLKEEMSTITISSLEAELEKIQSEQEAAQAKEKGYQGDMLGLPDDLQTKTEEADEAKSKAPSARQELNKAKDEAELAKASASAMELSLQAALKEIEATKATEKLALDAIKAMQESEEATTNNAAEISTSAVNIPLEEYFALSKRAIEAESLANERVLTAVDQIKDAKKRESMSREKLEAAFKEMKEMKEALIDATERAEKAKKGKLRAEQELRDWRAENGQRRKANEAAANNQAKNTRSFWRSFDESRDPNGSSPASIALRVNSTPNLNRFEADGPAPELRPRRKKSFFPRIVMFLARKKAQSLK